MENCIYNSKLICAYDLKDERGQYYLQRVEQLKYAAAKQELRCETCGAPVYLAAGPIREPYFAHYDREVCAYSQVKESENVKIGKRLLYQLLKRSFSNHEVYARYLIDNKIYATALVKLNQDVGIGLDYRRQYLGIEDFDQRHQIYMLNSVKPVYILDIQLLKRTKQQSWYQNIIQRRMGYCIFLDVNSETIILQKSFLYLDHGVRRIELSQKKYFLHQVLLNEEGKFICDIFEDWEAEEDKYAELLQNQLQTHTIHKGVLEKCLEMFQDGKKELISKKYLQFIMDNAFLLNP